MIGRAGEYATPTPYRLRRHGLRQQTRQCCRMQRAQIAVQLQGNPQKIYATHALLPPEPADKMFTKGTS